MTSRNPDKSPSANGDLLPHLNLIKKFGDKRADSRGAASLTRRGGRTNVGHLGGRAREALSLDDIRSPETRDLRGECPRDRADELRPNNNRHELGMARTL